MWHQILSRIWRRLPKRVRRFGIFLTQPRFTVTAGAVIVDDQNRVLLLLHRFRGGSGWAVGYKNWDNSQYKRESNSGLSSLAQHSEKKFTFT